jgi:hypothetical protein
MAEHPLHGEMGFARIGGPEHGGDARGAPVHASNVGANRLKCKASETMGDPKRRFHRGVGFL